MIDADNYCVPLPDAGASRSQQECADAGWRWNIVRSTLDAATILGTECAIPYRDAAAQTDESGCWASATGLDAAKSQNSTTATRNCWDLFDLDGIPSFADHDEGDRYVHSCPDGKEPGADLKNCVCPSGYVENRAGACVDINEWRLRRKHLRRRRPMPKHRRRPRLLLRNRTLPRRRLVAKPPMRRHRRMRRRNRLLRPKRPMRKHRRRVHLHPLPRRFRARTGTLRMRPRATRPRTLSPARKTRRKRKLLLRHGNAQHAQRRMPRRLVHHRRMLRIGMVPVDYQGPKRRFNGGRMRNPISQRNNGSRRGRMHTPRVPPAIRRAHNRRPSLPGPLHRHGRRPPKSRPQPGGKIPAHLPRAQNIKRRLEKLRMPPRL